MKTSKKHWGIVGGGILGMYLSYQLSKKGHDVTIMEADNNLGGLTSAWQKGKFSWDKFYHVILLSDTILRNLLDDIGLSDQLNWVETKTGFYTNGQLYSMSNTIEFLQFPPLSLFDKLRLGFTIFYASKIKNWRKLEGIHVADWLRKWSGKNTFEKIWLPLLRAKLGDNYQHTSAAFIWTTIQRMYAARRTGLKKEMFGYVNGGYSNILTTFEKHLTTLGVAIKTNCKISSIRQGQEGQVIVESNTDPMMVFDEVIVTTPSGIASQLCNDLSPLEVKQHEEIEYLGVICAVLLLKKGLSPFYVTNVTDNSPFTGIIEMTNIVNPETFDGNTLLYLPKYVKKEAAFYKWKKSEIKDLFWSGLRKMYPVLSDDDLIDFQVFKAPNVFALPVINYSEKLPPVSTTIPGVHILNSAHIVNGTLNVNETLQVVLKNLPDILTKAQHRKIKSDSYA